MCSSRWNCDYNGHLDISYWLFQKEALFELFSGTRIALVPWSDSSSSPEHNSVSYFIDFTNTWLLPQIPLPRRPVKTRTDLLKGGRGFPRARHSLPAEDADMPHHQTPARASLASRLPCRPGASLQGGLEGQRATVRALCLWPASAVAFLTMQWKTPSHKPHGKNGFLPSGH